MSESDDAQVEATIEAVGDLDDAPLEQDPEDLWDDFHAVVNMTSRELGEWLRTEESTTDAEPGPGGGGGGLTETGHQVLGILGKRRVDLTAADREVMAHVVRSVRAQRGDEPEPEAGDDAWRRALMTLGHDPLKPTA